MHQWGKVAIAAAAVTWSLLGSACSDSSAGAYLERPPEDEVIYFVLPDRFENGDTSNDRGGIEGGRLQHGFDPTHKGFFHGGDLKGLTSRLDYIEGLGATAIWLGPIYKNKPVQGDPGSESAGYHGYWITDFTDVDPHFGTKADLKAFVDAAHGRGIKVYLDIVINHTADVIRFRECHDPEVAGEVRRYGGCTYRSRADYPYTTRGRIDGAPINEGFMGDQPPYLTEENFARLVDPGYAYRPYIPEGEQDAKVPAWLNDMRYYHNRGDSTFEGESSLYGDFVGLDDLMTEDPRVVEGFISIFKDWVSDFRIDGFRVDTARHVNPEFWQVFIPALLEHAAAEGIPNFYIFGEAAIHEPGRLAKTTHRDRFPAVLDFPLFGAIKRVLIDKQSTDLLADLYAVDSLYAPQTLDARRLPVFNGNHDDGRFAGHAQRRFAGAPDEELYRRVRLAYALLFFGRGVPVVYYGDEQGFTGDGGDQDAREDMFTSLVASYNDNALIATAANTAEVNFDTNHPLYKSIASFASVYRQHTSLRRGEQKVRLSEKESGSLLALSRVDESSDVEYLVVFNSGVRPRSVRVDVDPRSTSWSSVLGTCNSAVSATGSYPVEVAPLDFVICRSDRK